MADEFDGETLAANALDNVAANGDPADDGTEVVVCVPECTRSGCIALAEFMRHSSAVAVALSTKVDVLQEAQNAAVRYIDAAKLATDSAYRERNQVVAAFTRTARNLGWPCHLGKHQEDGHRDPAEPVALNSWDPDWLNVVFVETPEGQVSWHIHQDEMPMFEGMPIEGKPWDGHTTEEKYARLAKLTSWQEWNEATAQMEVARKEIEAARWTTGKWACSTNDENFNCEETFDTREEAIEYATHHLANEMDLEDYASFYTGQVVALTADELADGGANGERIVEDIEEYLHDNLGRDITEDGIDATPEHIEDLNKRLRLTIASWLHANDLVPNWCHIEKQKDHTWHQCEEVDETQGGPSSTARCRLALNHKDAHEY